MRRPSALSPVTRTVNMWPNLPAGVLLLLLATGCHHDIRFEEVAYSTGSKQYDAGLVTVISPQTLGQVLTIKSWATGIANSWDARPGEMLRQIADVEFPQMVKSYRLSTQYDEPDEGASRLTVELSVPHYAFSDFHTTVVVQARVYRPGHALAFEKSYREEGDSQGGKMVGAGAFGMKSAVRQSSFDAYKKAFAKLRADLAGILEKSKP